MKNIVYIWKRELQAYFISPVAYIVVVLFLVITGALFWLGYFQEINLLSLRSFFNQAPLFLAFFAPAITMGLIATEKRSGTLELMMTMPVSDFQIVTGKFLAGGVRLKVMPRVALVPVDHQTRQPASGTDFQLRHPTRHGGGDNAFASPAIAEDRRSLRYRVADRYQGLRPEVSQRA